MHSFILLFDFQKYLPEAPIEPEESTEADKNNEKTEVKNGKPEEAKPEEVKPVPSLQFSHVECALFALHSLCRKTPEALSADTARLKALRLRLQYTARLTQGYIKKLKEVTTQVIYLLIITNLASFHLLHICRLSGCLRAIWSK